MIKLTSGEMFFINRNFILRASHLIHSVVRIFNILIKYKIRLALDVVLDIT